MDLDSTRQQLATRMNELLQREIGHGFEVERLLGRERYARDVLLVCDACAHTELPALAAQFRALADGVPAGPHHGQQADPTASSRDPEAASAPLHGHADDASLPSQAQPTARPAPAGWRARLRWRRA